MIVERLIAIHHESLGEISFDAIAARYPNLAAEGKNARPTDRAEYTVEKGAQDAVVMAAAMGRGGSISTVSAHVETAR